MSGEQSNVNWTRETLRSAFQGHAIAQYSWPMLDNTSFSAHRKAAVLVPLFLHDGAIHVWLTKRSDKVSYDKGHVSFPGGMKEPADRDEVATCLRESHEEIGLDPGQVEVLGQLYPRLNNREILVTPVVGIVDDDFRPVPNDEVALAFHLPLDRFLTMKNCTTETGVYKGASFTLFLFHDTINGENVTTWGLTALIATELAVAILKKETEYNYLLDDKLLPSDPFLFSRTFFLTKLNKEIVTSRI